MKIVKVWCRQKRTILGAKSYKRYWQKQYSKTPPRQTRRWTCPDCKRRFVVATHLNYDGDVIFEGPPHKKRVKCAEQTKSRNFRYVRKHN